MTKAELIKKLKDLPDDTVIYIPSYDDERCDFTTAIHVEVESDGSDGCEAEVSLY